MKTNQNNKDEELRFENEFRKLKISLELGANFISDENSSEIPPEIEKLFLDNVEAFEKALKNAEQISVFDFLNRPELIDESKLNDEELKTELEKLISLMSDNCMTCDVIYEVDDRKFYKFITEELIHVNTMNVKVPDFMKHFIYEEFHPNLEEDAKSLCKDLWKRFLEDRLDNEYRKILVKCIDSFEELKSFRHSFHRVIDGELNFNTVNISGHLATVIFDISFFGIVSEGVAPIKYEGTGKFKLEFGEGGEFWIFTFINFPGMRSIS